ncbi:MAG: TIGR02757 family protein [Cytophagales bacterium]|nr:MAG: TIGR02757 family protein [Cytophagales bacterium]
MKTFINELLDEYVEKFNQPQFIAADPISIPHQYSQLQDIEIAALFAAVLAWGKRSLIIKKCQELMQLMDNSPYDFIRNHQDQDLKSLLHFKHRTFNTTDLLYFIHFLRHHYQQHHSLETAFLQHHSASALHVGKALEGFFSYFFSLPEAPTRTQKHISTPAKKSACKRINMFLRWMVRKDDKGVDFGIWKNIAPHQLICPLDIHVERVAKKLNLLTRKNPDWQAALALTEKLRLLSPEDPVRYDFALFGLGISHYFD